MSTLPPRDFPPSTTTYESQPRKSNTLWWILGILGVVIIGGGLLCCGGLYFAGKFGMDMAGQQVQTQIANDPVVVEHIGQVEAVSLDIMATGERNEPGTVVFKIEGSKGSGLLVGRQGPGGQMTDMVLEMPDGEAYPLSATTATEQIEVETPESDLTEAEDVDLDAIPADSDAQ